MDKFDYDKVIELKKEGKFDECEKLYHDYLSEYKNYSEGHIDFNFYSGFAKIMLLKRDYTRAKLLLIGAFRKFLEEKIRVLEIFESGNKVETFADSMQVTIINKAHNEYKIISSVIDMDEYQQNTNLSMAEILMGLCSDIEDLMFRYFYCEVCALEIPTTATSIAEIKNKIIKNGSAIEKALQGTASVEEKNIYEEVYDYAIYDKRNKWQIVLLILPEIIQACKNLNKL